MILTEDALERLISIIELVFDGACICLVVGYSHHLKQNNESTP